MKFELIDRVIEQTPDRIVALKNVSAAEEYLADHFPGFAVLPGVMMLEALVQAGRLLLAEQSKGATGAGRPLVLAEVRNIRYGNMVRPGQSLKVEVTLKPPAAAGTNDRPGWELTGVGSVDDQVAVQGKFRLAPI